MFSALLSRPLSSFPEPCVLTCSSAPSCLSLPTLPVSLPVRTAFPEYRPPCLPLDILAVSPVLYYSLRGLITRHPDLLACFSVSRLCSSLPVPSPSRTDLLVPDSLPGFIVCVLAYSLVRRKINLPLHSCNWTHTPLVLVFVTLSIHLLFVHGSSSVSIFNLIT